MVSSTVDALLPASLSAVFDSSDDDDQGLSHTAEILNCNADQPDLDVKCEASALLSSELVRLTAEHKEAGHQLEEQLSCLGLSASLLAPAARTDLQTIAAVAEELRLQECQHSAFLLALSQLRTQECQMACAQHESQELDIWLADKETSALQQLNKLQNVLQLAQRQAEESASRASSHNQNVEMLAQKAQQYMQQLENLEQKLASAKYSPLLRHKELMERQTTYDEQSKQVAAKEAKISQFAGLPSDMAAATAVYNSKLQALLNARKQLEEGLADF